ncbi:MAG: 5,6-dimethylbenzimidazole synthase [Oceanospirillales bacterium]|uniref:Cob(II)yrinic acid a,c-diamide reductase n=1 Tax=Marinobacterium halophilum TaxID=267374 RepID=A0A2P8ERW1_9GAMM|nr:5,6-dimethylbenzimidazole synthase [Marinobacterium halophilum]MBR9829602.1 5,6-dimethylbenzimidazole synthase [Oceanospirillales bacterium]PSL12206.1 cob(II)yrinic acid a,c-diamide reductase [Marinobacterium halophilum]
MSDTPWKFSALEREAVYRAIRERRDMRHFSGDPLDPEILTRLLQAAHQAPSVGLMQPWRFIRITDTGLRGRIRTLVEQERQATADAMNAREAEFLRLKVEGMDQCAEVLVVALMDQREKHIFGRRTLPEMDLASVSCAIQNLWLAARAEGIGVGWVSLFDPDALGDLLQMPTGSKAIAILCIGPVDKFYARPMLEQEGWADAQPLADLMAENCWPNGHEHEE